MRVQVKEFLDSQGCVWLLVTKKTIQTFNFDPYLKWITIHFIKTKFKNE